MSNKKNKLIFSFLFIITVFFFLNTSYALEDRCKIEKALAKDDSALNLWKWEDSLFVGLIARPMFKSVSGLTPDEVMGCEEWIYENKITDEERENITDLGACSGTPDEVCATAIEGGLIGYSDNSSEYAYGSPEYFNTYRVSKTSGSLLGVAHVLDDYLYNEPPPVNMAYFWNDSIKYIPVVNSALAADLYENNPHPLISAILVVWKGVRNIALGLMSAILLYTGILIVLRKKVNSQLVVTVQYAIPKIIIGLLLIIFSYPIGALITNLGWTLFFSAGPIIKPLFSTTGYEGIITAMLAGGVGALMLAMIILGFAPGIGWAALLALLIVIIAALIMYLIVRIKALVIYLKMAFSIISAPIEFAIGTIPGSEDRIIGWFKRMAKYAVTLFLMGGVIQLTLILSVIILAEYNNQAGWGLGYALAIIAPIFIVLFGFGMAVNMDKKVGEFFGEKPTRRK